MEEHKKDVEELPKFMKPKTGSKENSIRRHKELEEKKKEIAGKMRIKSHTLMGTPSTKDYSKERKYNRKAYQKGKESLNIPRGEKNEGNNMYEGKNENNRQ